MRAGSQVDAARHLSFALDDPSARLWDKCARSMSATQLRKDGSKLRLTRHLLHSREDGGAGPPEVAG